MPVAFFLFFLSLVSVITQHALASDELWLSVRSKENGLRRSEKLPESELQGRQIKKLDGAFVSPWPPRYQHYDT